MMTTTNMMKVLVDVGEDDNDNEDVDVKPETRQRRLMFLPSSSAKDVSTIVCCLGGVMTIMKKGMKRIMSIFNGFIVLWFGASLHHKTLVK